MPFKSLVKAINFLPWDLSFTHSPCTDSLCLSVHLYKDCGETVFTLCCKVHGIKELLGEQNILSCFCHRIKAPGLGALTLSKASEERRGNLSHLGPSLSSGCDSGTTCLVLAQVGEAGLGSCPFQL